MSQYVGRLLPLTFLAPDVVEAIIKGRQPVDRTAEALTSRVDLALDWTAQKRALGFIYLLLSLQPFTGPRSSLGPDLFARWR